MLISLVGFPKLPTLRGINLSHNELSGEFEILVQNCPRLRFINLSANKIEEIEALEPFKDLSELKVLDLTDCSVTKLPNYRENVLTLLPQIIYLDGYDRNGRPIPEDFIEPLN
ncbi:unnamed protein product [Meloidogyne enterolobii]|uniref:Uncharacterized protein n=1 Tax=Meloidogyne enterolobii TaxID=390850 RepID=A0ACB0YLT4_MELEN